VKASVDDIENIDPVLTARVVAVLAPFVLARDPKFGTRTEGPSSRVEANLLAAAFLDAAHSIPNGGLFHPVGEVTLGAEDLSRNTPPLFVTPEPIEAIDAEKVVCAGSQVPGTEPTAAPVIAVLFRKVQNVRSWTWPL
jgi:hypothetical protein